MNRKLISMVGVAVMVLVAAGTAHAQGQVQVIGGVTKADRTEPLIGGLVGVKVGIFEIDAEGGRMFNIVPRGVADTTRTLSLGVATAKLPAWYGLGQLRLIAQSGPVRPFISGGLGFAVLQPQVQTSTTSSSTVVIFGSDNNQTKFMATAGGGVRFVTGPVSVEGGYRYMRVFQHYNNDTNFNNDSVLVSVNSFYAALGLRF